jgi:hypothetical protein
VDSSPTIGVSTYQADAQLCATGVLCLSQYDTKKIAAYDLDTGKLLWSKESVPFNPFYDDLFPDRVMITSDVRDAAGGSTASVVEILDPRTGQVTYKVPDGAFPRRLSRDGILLPLTSGDVGVDALTGQESPLNTDVSTSVPCDWTEGFLACVARDGRFTVWKVASS